MACYYMGEDIGFLGSLRFHFNLHNGNVMSFFLLFIDTPCMSKWSDYLFFTLENVPQWGGVINCDKIRGVP